LVSLHCCLRYLLKCYAFKWFNINNYC
jgi:hypothetical protein